MAKNKLVVMGSINVDHILNVERIPELGETVIGQQYNVAFGGKGANQSVAAGRSGANVTFIACVGEDNIGERICKQLSSDSIDIQAIKIIKGYTTGVALILVNNVGQNVIAIHSGANSALTPEYLSYYHNIIIAADALLVQLESPLDSVMAAVTLAKQHNKLVILNPAPACELPDDFLAYIDIITPNETEAQRLTGVIVNNDQNAANAANILHDKGISTVIITLGERGVWLSQARNGKRVPGFKVQPIDTIAAGDTFNGALATALLEGQELDKAVYFAHAAAAIAVTRQGAQPSIPWRKEIDAFLQSHTC